MEHEEHHDGNLELVPIQLDFWNDVLLQGHLKNLGAVEPVAASALIRLLLTPRWRKATSEQLGPAFSRAAFQSWSMLSQKDTELLIRILHELKVLLPTKNNQGMDCFKLKSPSTLPSLAKA